MKDDINDIPGWRWKKGRPFSTKSAYEALSGEAMSEQNAAWRIIWKTNMEDFSLSLRKFAINLENWDNIVWGVVLVFKEAT
ncbi:hypothetical protein GOBAR_AA25945 [Gossypium barbadense]|uniref:Uncharacterized protein n=1 Tax=Gossypium barbadense TaxID=3634 RepID=A0A2P5WUH5_GOSBA|nr:hypothetical protein GOBAR_AA25945 [Gossypium barbadense]